MQRCLDSVMGQTYSHFEVFVIDDASSEIFEYKKDSRVQVIRNAKNLGPGASRNVGLQRAKGEFVAFLDSDDYWDANFLKSSVTALIKNPSVAMAYANGINVDENGKTQDVRRNQIKQLDRILPEILSLHRHWGTGGCLWRKIDIQNIQWITSRTWEDYAFDIDVAIHNNSIIGLQETLVYYDISGKDKLSERISDDLMAQKISALQHISDALCSSKWRNDGRIKKAFRYLIVMNFLASSNQDEKQLLSHIFNRWNGFFSRFLWKLVLKLPESRRMDFLELVTRVYRKQMR
ncbi:glycosyltransferase [Aequorivita sp. H23M31]|uniref:Glycosyltransferase n=1 Tax=Aequorivita ciconiae TaxID=2494375 RepID=A0A410G2A0_9FLAO|nr:glycosyltransferase family 2 protein [Aequorivita sp. H23M31]QAA81370.1 glycosyltransferase [Aequorivita sp. H23M31]